MTYKDLQLLVEFRCEVPAPDEKTARRIYDLATSGQPWRRSRVGLRLPRGSRLVIALAAAALVLIPTALAFGSKIVDLFEGAPAPPSISSNFAANNALADMATQEGFALQFPHADVSKAHGVMEIQTTDGPEDLWVAPNDQGGQCWFIDFANDPPGSNGRQYGGGGCDPSSPPSSNINWSVGWELPHPSLMTVWGHVYVDAVTVQLTLADGRRHSELWRNSVTETASSLEPAEAVRLAVPLRSRPRTRSVAWASVLSPDAT
jgi:hypothetical protein